MFVECEQHKSISLLYCGVGGHYHFAFEEVAATKSFVLMLAACDFRVVSDDMYFYLWC